MAALATLPLTLAAYSTYALAAQAQTREAAASSNAVLTINNSANGPFTRNFNPLLNPYNPGVSEIYEPLLMWDALTGKESPWLAASYQWSDGDKRLTFSLQPHITWSNGQPFTSADVVETFDIIKKNPALNSYGITFNSVTKVGPDKVAFTFGSPAAWQFYYITSVLIVPASVWKTVANPATFADPNPVGTGAYTLSSWSSRNIYLKVNPHYWGMTPHVPTLIFEAEDTATTCGEDLERGTLQWANCIFPHYQQLFVNQNPRENVTWFPSYGTEGLWPNLKDYPLNLLPLREAISLVINRRLLSTEGEDSAQPPATSPTGLLPQDSAYLAPQYKNLTFKTNVPKARSVLKKGGFKFAADGQLLAPDGKPVTLNILNWSALPDFMADGEIIISELKQIGIKATQTGYSTTPYFNYVETRHYQIAFFFESQPTASPYGLYQVMLNPSLLEPVGKTSTGDDEGYTNPLAAKYLADYKAATTNAQQLAAFYGLEKLMVTQLPVIPVLHNVYDCVFTSRDFVGWPTPKNPYSMPDSLSSDALDVILHLHPRA